MREGPLAHRCGLVIGMSGGIGLAIAAELTGAGARVVGTARRPASTAQAPLLELDLRDPAAVAGVFASLAVERPLDFVVHCAAIGLYAPLAAESRDAWREMLETNVLGMLAVLTAIRCQPIPLKDLIHVGSVAARQPSRVPGNMCYSASKAAQRSLLRSFGRLGPDGLRITTIDPGFVRGTRFGERFLATAPAGHPDPIGDAPALAPADVARLARFALETPPHVELGTLTARPRARAVQGGEP
jgi:NADP-dependent 3-hydroxy acid dehydrogenase YdfG